MSYQRSGKRVLDLLAALVALVTLSPLLLLTILLITLDDGRPVFYTQQRIGRGMRAFRIYKFRSMRKGTESMTSVSASTDSITRIGRIIRRTNIDELPQLVNILLGDMSIVGPRPALESQQTLIDERRRSGVTELRPGLTGLAQVNAVDGMTEKEKADWDAKYLGSVSLIGDVAIILRTVAYLFRRQPVY